MTWINNKWTPFFFPQSCAGDGDGSDIVCVPIMCNIFQLQQGGNARLDITAHLDDRIFAVSLEFT